MSSAKMQKHLNDSCDAHEMVEYLRVSYPKELEIILNIITKTSNAKPELLKTVFYQFIKGNALLIFENGIKNFPGVMEWVKTNTVYRHHAAICDGCRRTYCTKVHIVKGSVLELIHDLFKEMYVFGERRLCSGFQGQLKKIVDYYTIQQTSEALALISTPTSTTTTESVDTLSTVDTYIESDFVAAAAAEESIDKSISEYIDTRITSLEEEVLSKFGCKIMIKPDVYKGLTTKRQRSKY
jgi:hypothetical protein